MVSRFLAIVGLARMILQLSINSFRFFKTRSLKHHTPEVCAKLSVLRFRLNRSIHEQQLPTGEHGI